MADILFDTVGRAGIITLNRPKALNALTEDMVLAFAEALDEWAQDDRIARVAVRAEGKAFCAGGDIRNIYERRAGAADFFAAEYRNNARVAAFPKPYVALMNGIAMGGGVGVSCHGSHRVAGENLTFAMPETGIGLVPDVGATHILANLDGQQGRRLALTAARIGRDEAANLGLVTHPVDGATLEDALDRTAHARNLDDALGDLTVDCEPADEELARFVAEVFAADTVPEIRDRLEERAGDHEAASQMAASMAQKSPTSLTLALEAQKRHGEGTVADALTTEFRMVSRLLDGPDLFEGIRAVVIDKDNAPRWSPAELEGVDPEEIEAYFAEPAHGDLDLSDVKVAA